MSEELTPRQETAAWLRRPLTENEDRYHDFLERFQRDDTGEKFLIGYAYLLTDTTNRKIPVPQEILTKVHGVTTDEEGNEVPKVMDMLFEDFSLQVIDIPDGKSLFTLGARLNKCGRMRHVNANDLHDWNTGVGAFGFPMKYWMTRVQRAARLAEVFPNAGE